jgi:hypothetical protein
MTVKRLYFAVTRKENGYVPFTDFDVRPIYEEDNHNSFLAMPSKEMIKLGKDTDTLLQFIEIWRQGQNDFSSLKLQNRLNVKAFLSLNIIRREIFPIRDAGINGDPLHPCYIGVVSYLRQNSEANRVDHLVYFGSWEHDLALHTTLYRNNHNLDYIQKEHWGNAFSTLENKLSTNLLHSLEHKCPIFKKWFGGMVISSLKLPVIKDYMGYDLYEDPMNVVDIDYEKILYLDWDSAKCNSDGLKKIFQNIQNRMPNYIFKFIGGPGSMALRHKNRFKAVPQLDHNLWFNQDTLDD